MKVRSINEPIDATRSLNYRPLRDAEIEPSRTAEASEEQMYASWRKMFNGGAHQSHSLNTSHKDCSSSFPQSTVPMASLAGAATLLSGCDTSGIGQMLGGFALGSILSYLGMTIIGNVLYRKDESAQRRMWQKLIITLAITVVALTPAALAFPEKERGGFLGFIFGFNTAGPLDWTIYKIRNALRRSPPARKPPRTFSDHGSRLVSSVSVLCEKWLDERPKSKPIEEELSHALAYFYGNIGRDKGQRLIKILDTVVGEQRYLEAAYKYIHIAQGLTTDDNNLEDERHFVGALHFLIAGGLILRHHKAEADSHELNESRHAMMDAITGANEIFGNISDDGYQVINQLGFGNVQMYTAALGQCVGVTMPLTRA